jgi:hypothetical protein
MSGLSADTRAPHDGAVYLRVPPLWGDGVMKRKGYWVFKNGRHTRVPGVTTILNHVGDKKGLQNWHFKQGIEAMFRAVSSLVETLNDEPIKPSRIFQRMPPFPESAWEMENEAAEVGKIVHLMVECDILGNEFPTELWPAGQLAQAQKAFEAWERWRDQREFFAESTEEELVSNLFGYGGRQDLTTTAITTKWGKYRILIDLKTGRIYPEHWMQLAAYGQLWLEHYPERPIDGYALLRLGKVDGSFRYEEQVAGSQTMHHAWLGFLSAHSAYHEIKQLEKASR